MIRLIIIVFFSNRLSPIRTSLITHVENELSELHDDWIKWTTLLKTFICFGKIWMVFFLDGKKFSHVLWSWMTRVQGEELSLRLCLRVCVCVCVCVYLCVCVYVHLYMCMCMCICVCVCICVPCVYIHVCICVYVWMYVCM